MELKKNTDKICEDCRFKNYCTAKNHQECLEKLAYELKQTNKSLFIEKFLLICAFALIILVNIKQLGVVSPSIVGVASFILACCYFFHAYRFKKPMLYLSAFLYLLLAVNNLEAINFLKIFFALPFEIM